MEAQKKGGPNADTAATSKTNGGLKADTAATKQKNDDEIAIFFSRKLPSQGSGREVLIQA